MDWNKRLMKEARSFVPDEIVLSLAPVEDRLDYWRATISGPKDSPYEGGISFLITTGTFELEITVPKTYPMSPPQINFFTPLCHPNIEFSSGKICLDLLNDAWTPSWSIYSALGAVAILLQVCISSIIYLLESSAR
jgi:peroxin-4